MKINSGILARIAFATGLALSAVAPAGADTPISGSINSNQTWTQAQSPYVLSGEVETRFGAVLTIQPGTVVQFQPGARLRVNTGAVNASGTASNRIVFTSVNDRAGSPTPAAAGDWDGLLVDDGANDAQTRFAYADVRFGKGLVIHSASPTIDHVNFTGNAGPAIALDLTSSPQGGALQASGNQINGIQVPAGSLTGEVHWRLTGIPYVLASGEIAIGAVPPTLSPSTQTLPPHSSGTLQLDLGGVADAGGVRVDLSSSSPSVASVPTHVIVPAGLSSVSVAVNTGTAGLATITATRQGVAPATAGIRVANAMSITLSPNSPSVAVGASLTMRIAIGEARPDDTVFQMALTSPSVVSLPETVTIPAGDTSAEFVVQGVAAGSTLLTAGHPENYAQTTIWVTEEYLNWSNGTAQLGVGSTSVLYIALSRAAPVGGATVTFQSSNGNASTPASVVVPEGENYVDVPVTGVALGEAEITASAPGYASDTLVANVSPIEVLFHADRFDGAPQPSISTEIPLDLYDQFTMALSAPAPQGGVTVTLTSDNPSVSSPVPATIFIAEGDTRADTAVRFTATQPGEAVITAHVDGFVDATAGVTVGEQRVELHWTEAQVVVGHSLVRRVNLTRTLNGEGFSWPVSTEIQISASNSAALGVPAAIDFPMYNTSAEVPLTGLAVASAPITITVSAPGYVTPPAHLMATVETPTLVFEGMAGNRSLGSPRDGFYMQWRVGPEQETQTPDEAQTLQIAIADAVPAGIVEGVYASQQGGTPIGEVEMSPYGPSNTYYVGSPVAEGSYAVRVTLAGVGSWSTPVSVDPPQLRWNPGVITLGKGLSADATLYRVSADGHPLYAAEDIEITLQSADAGKVSAPATATMYAGTNYAYVRLAGIDFAEAVTITATAAGHGTGDALVATVVLPQLEIYTTYGEQGIDSERNGLGMAWKVNGQYQWATNDQTLQLEIVDATPAGIVSGFYDQASGGNAVTTVSIPAGNPGPSTSRYVGSPTATGSYAVRVTLPGTGSWTTDPVTVLPVELYWFHSEVVIGNGVKTTNIGVGRVLAGTQIAARPANPVAVTLACADTSVCALPPTATIQPGNYAVNVDLRGTGLGTTQASASATGHPTVTMAVETRTPALLIASMPASMRVGTQRTLSAQIRVPGSDLHFVALQSVPITLTSTSPATLSLPASASIAADSAWSSNFTLQANALGSASVSASAPGFDTFTSPLITVTP